MLILKSNVYFFYRFKSLSPPRIVPGPGLDPLIDPVEGLAARALCPLTAPDEEGNGGPLVGTAVREDADIREGAGLPCLSDEMEKDN